MSLAAAQNLQTGDDRNVPFLPYEEFLRRTDGIRAEWVAGRTVPMAPVSNEHDKLSVFLIRVLGQWVEMRDLGRVLHEPFQMKTSADLPGRSPDVMFVPTAEFHRIGETHLEGPASLVIEIVSPESRGRDRGDKFFEYEKGGVQEYWVVDPERQQAEFYLRGSDGIYRPSMPGLDGVYKSVAMLGLWIEVRWLWNRPPLVDVMKAWGAI